MTLRIDKRKPDQMRDVKITRDYLKYAEGSCLIEVGNTKVICSASIEDKVPPFLRDQNTGWVTAEYGMLPRACQTRTPREAARGKMSGRTYEIQRLIGRSLRAVVDLSALGERTIWIDCDVIQGDGGTRTASITGSFLALMDALNVLKAERKIEKIPVTEFIAAVSCGIVNGQGCLDLCYEEDSNAEVDMNVIMTESYKIIEIQGTAEGKPFSEDQMQSMMNLAKKGIKELVSLQKKTISVNANTD